MDRDPYASFQAEEMILRDFLAADRTALANERTLLAYVRTALAFGGGAAALLHFFDTTFVQVIGWSCIPIAIGILAVGVWRFLQLRARIDSIAVKRRSLKKHLQGGNHGNL